MLHRRGSVALWRLFCYRGVFDSAFAVIHKIDDIFLTSATKFRFVGRSILTPATYAARRVDGVESARPIYAEWTNSRKNPRQKDRQRAGIGVRSDQPVFLFPEVGKHLPAASASRHRTLRQTGVPVPQVRDAETVTELSRRHIRIINAKQDRTLRPTEL
jgi:hypothetical protein